MLPIVLLIIQFLILIFIGGFARSTQTITSFTSVGPNMLFLLSWTLVCTPLKKLTLTSLTLLLITIALTFECNLLFGRFWSMCFTSFSTSYQLSMDIFIEGTLSVFAVLLVVIDYIGVFRYWQLFLLLVPIINFFWAFNFAVLRYGLAVFDGGGAFTVFLFAGVLSIVIWVVSIRQRHHYFGGEDLKGGDQIMRADIYIREEYYEGYTISLFGGLIGIFILWPQLNSSTALLSSVNTRVNPLIKGSVIFQNSAYFNTILALAVGTLCSFMLLTRDGTRQEKQKIRCLIDCLINCGIICSPLSDITLNPSTTMSMSLFSTILTLLTYIYHKNIQTSKTSTSPKNKNLSNFMILIMYYSRPLFRIVMSLFGSIVSAIVVATRQATGLQLLDVAGFGDAVYALAAGMQVVGFFVTLGVAVVGGVVVGVAVNLFILAKNKDVLKAQIQENVAKAAKSEKPKQDELATPKKVRKQSQNQARKLDFRSGMPRQGKLNDLNFLQTEQQQQMFPLFLQEQDIYIDQQKTARKLLKQAILSHVKSNYVSINNYNSNKNVNTNNTQQQQQLPQPIKKINNFNFAIQKDFVFRNQRDGTHQYTNNLESITPRSGASQIKNQTKEIVDMVNKDKSIFKDKSYQREAMPTFYMDHHLNQSADKSLLNRLNRSKTQTNFNPKISSKKIDNQRPLSIGFPQIKKTQSQTFPTPARQSHTKLDLSNVKAISESREEEDYRSRHPKQQKISKQTLNFMTLNNSMKEAENDRSEKENDRSEKEKDNQSEIMDENLNYQFDRGDSQII